MDAEISTIPGPFYHALALLSGGELHNAVLQRCQFTGVGDEGWYDCGK